ncbi:hypothetical protein [Raineya orbicola]|jgi:hypothetical protein|uniref:Uncharacterized protein n=1 Tax=Raineya orbicola TaxID=2016530 RepID=A0A2N3IEZ4_9BACT|nr:hypothetical protein [Raineya orbicola]PKQ68881.1 hypothetical protein Rain11_1536 [Raineya orbicola]
MKVFWFIFLMSLGMLPDKEKHPIFHKHKDIIEEATEVALYEVKATPIASKDQEKDKVYLGDYEMLKKVEISAENAENLKKAVLDTNNYISEKKTCPMQAKYALKFSKKRHYITLIISENTCEKMIIFSSEKDINKHYHDFKTPNSLYPLIEK